jgi:hypothetical protein
MVDVPCHKVETLTVSLHGGPQPIPLKSLPFNLLLEQGKQNGDQAKHAIFLSVQSRN